MILDLFLRCPECGLCVDLTVNTLGMRNYSRWLPACYGQNEWTHDGTQLWRNHDPVQMRIEHIRDRTDG